MRSWVQALLGAIFLEDKFLILYCSISNTRRELQNALKNSKRNINESSDSDTLEVIKVSPRKIKIKLFWKAIRKQEKKFDSLWFIIMNEKEMMQDLLQN